MESAVHPISHLLCAALAVCFLFSAPAADANPVLKTPGASRIVAETARHGPMPIWLYRPKSAGADAPIVIVMHGVQRDADRYLAEWIQTADAENFVVVAPEFSREAFPGAEGYILGGLRDEKGKSQPKAAWSFTVVEEVFDAAKAALGLNASGYALFGHSAGGQFVHRFVTYQAGPRMIRAVSANSGWYTRPQTEIAWPFGIGDAPAPIDLDAALTAPMTILLGTADIDPNHRSLNRDADAMAQGPHRYARGLSYFAAARAQAEQRGVALAWTCVTAPGIAHDNAGMAPFAAPILLGRGPRADGPPCPS
jgi:poly(3-hydroxybutyrate) depolymerase